MFMMDIIFSLVGVLTSVAFFTLMERKVMGLMHYRKGPNKIAMAGISQPLADALKLLTKETQKMSTHRLTMFLMGPAIMLLLMLTCWCMYESLFNNMTSSLKMIMILSTMSLSVYSFILTSWGSNSQYSMMGGYRVIAQIISYEVSLILIIVAMIFMFKTLSISEMKLSQSGVWLGLSMLPLFMVWVVLCMAETNRTPFDLAEGESEIVSGFNIEYGSTMFALIFISEYGMMIFLSFLTSLMFLGGVFLMMKTLTLCLMFVWIRASFPRVRYEDLMMVSWKIMIPYSISMVAMGGAIM